MGDEHTNICDGRSDSDFDARVALLSEFALEELVEFCVKDTVGDELAALGDGALLGSHVAGVRCESWAMIEVRVACAVL
jgi:hypothetical protein